MKKSRVIVTSIIFILFLITALLNNEVQATPVNPVVYFGIAEIRTTTQMGYAMGDPAQGAEKIWKIVKYSNTNYNDPTEVNAYCIKADQGFSNESAIDIYDVSYNMKTERNTIAEQNDVLKGLVNGGQYDNLLALADILYIKDVSTASEREHLLEASGANDIVEKSDFNGVEEYYITDDEIDATQQAAIWYFTNYQEGGEYDKYGESAWAWYTSNSDNGQYKSLSSYNPTNMPYASARAGYYRQQQMAKLYDYLIDTAKSNASKGLNDEKTILTVYASNLNAEAQPIMQVTKLPKEFDLSLRKYITEVNDEPVQNSRIPNIDKSTLETGTTATYKHRKDPIEVKLNDTITYNITIYNEGEKAGRATEIVDQLPTGLEFVEVVSGNFEKSTYSTQNNTLYLTRKSNNTTNLSAYTEGNLSSETIQIKCKVTATGGQSDKILTNIAWISEEIDEDGNIITNEAGEDRDSEPSTITTQTKDALVSTDDGYIGNSSNNGKVLTNSENYFEGQQDDDDFEKVIVRAVTNVEVSKVWEDNSNQDGIRATEIKVELLKNGEPTGQIITLNESENWSGKFENLPTKENGQDVTYSVKETTTINGYTTNTNSTTDASGKSYTITNSHTPETISVTVNKTWADSQNQDGLRPSEIEVALKKGTETLQTVKLNASNDWKHIFTGLAKYENGQEIEYTVEEVNVPEGYTESQVENSENNFTITNTHIPEITEITAKKQWNDNNNQDGLRPESVEFELYKNNTATGTRKTLSGDNWTVTFDNLPVYENGQKITYTVKEVNEPEGYTASGEGTEENGYTITNTHTPEVTEITAKKQWNDNNNQDGLRPENVEFELYKNNTATGNKKTLTGDTWTVTFDNLPVYENGQKITYTVKEINELEGYTASGEGTEENGYTIINTHTPGLTNVNVNKVWNDNNDQDGIRPGEIVVELLKNGQGTGNSITLNAGNGWAGTFDNLPVNEDGEKITYTVKEISVDGYEVQITSNGENNFTITNTHATEITEITAKKQWNDNNNQDGLRPESVEFELYKNNEATGTKKTLTGDNWTVTFDNLPVYEEGKEITYTVKEVNEPEGYTASGEGTEENGYTITNTHTPGLTNVNVNKVWNDNNDQDGIRPEEIQVELLKNGQGTGNSITLNEGNGWAGTFDNLPVYEEGEEIIYTVKEITVSGYDVQITSNGENNFTITNTYTPEVIEITAKKQWNDNNNQDGLRPESVEFELYKNNEATGTKKTLTGDNWTVTFDNLPVYENGQKITYTVKEVNEPEGYIASGEGTEENGYTITNTHTPGLTSVNVNKVWNDNNDQDGIRPEEIQVELLKNEQETGNTVTLNAGNNWTGKFENLPVNENGEKIIYTVKEITVNGYAVNITQNSENNFTITNTHTPGVTSVNVNKVWDDQNNQDGLRPESIEIELLKNGEPTGNIITLSEENHWTGTFDNLPVKEDGVDIDYTVRENTQIEGYTTEITENTETANNTNYEQSVADVEEAEITTQTYAAKDMVRASLATVEPKSFRITNTHIVEEAFDLSLRKFIVAVSKDETIEESDILMNEDGTTYEREPVVDASNLNKSDEDGNTITTAIYNHTKEPVLVEKNDIVVYMLRVYNEGEQDGYAAEIKDYLPPYLTFVDGEFNEQYGWEVSEDGRTVTTRYLENSLIAKPETDESGNNTLSYVQVPIMCRVSDSANANENITNIADITEYQYSRYHRISRCK